ncbi:MAG: diguanylate cyclase [Phycisphaerae bacterium]
MPHPCDICIIEGNVDQRASIFSILRNAGYTCQAVSDGKAGLALMQECDPKIVISARELPQLDGLELCTRLRESAESASTFFLMTMSHLDPQEQERALKAGVDECLAKPIDQGYLLTLVRIGTRISEANRRLRRAAITDGLTGLYNHDYITTVIDRELGRARRYGNRLSLIMLDLDFFKAVNDTFGHLAGNATLVEVARILNESVREFDAVGRYGGEEFAIVAPEASLEDAVAISQRIRLAIADTLHIPQLHDHQVTASLGVATADDLRVRSPADLIDLADRALYAAKNGGRNRVATPEDFVSEECNNQIEREEVEALRKRVAVLGVQAKDVCLQSVSSLVQALEEKDPFTAKHSLNVSYYSEMIAKTMGLNDALTQTIRHAGLLHDVGKVGIPDRILMKPAGLSDIEAIVMQQVPAITVRILDHLRILESEMHIIRHQREYYDGSGYPDRLLGEQIPIGSRIVLVANAFDAMTTDRVYRRCRSIKEGLAELSRTAGTQFDPKVMQAATSFANSHYDDIRKRIRSTADALRSPELAF